MLVPVKDLSDVELNFLFCKLIYGETRLNWNDGNPILRADDGPSAKFPNHLQVSDRELQRLSKQYQVELLVHRDEKGAVYLAYSVFFTDVFRPALVLTDSAARAVASCIVAGVWGSGEVILHPSAVVS
jgi:hypothetical protein